MTARQSLALPFSKLLFDESVIPLIPSLTTGKIVEIVTRRETIYARIDFSEVPISAVVDSRGCALLVPTIAVASRRERQRAAETGITAAGYSSRT